MKRSWLLCLSTCLALQAVLWWCLCSSQVPGFISIDCGSNDTSVYTDANSIEWVGDADLITEGISITLNGSNLHVLSTLRLFEGNHSKYCYNLTNSVIKEGSVFMVRASFWAGITPPYTPQNSDGNFRFKVIVDADSWNVTIPYGTTAWRYSDIYIRAQSSSINACFARSSPGGDAPFVSALEVRPLPSTLMSTMLLLNSSRYFLPLSHSDYGVASTAASTITRYPVDPFDRLWLSYTASPPNIIETTSAISTDRQQDKVPGNILQNAYTGTAITFNLTHMDPEIKYFAELYFAEIDPAVNASGQRAFNILVNEELVTTSGPIDVFDAVGANAAYGYGIVAVSNEEGLMTITLTPTATSIYQPYVAAAEFFYTQFSNPITDADTVSALNSIKASLNLTSYQGDPCFPIGYGFEWLTCTENVPNVTTISLSNYGTGGVIPVSLNSLTLLTQIHLDGNALQGEIPNLSALTNLETLVLSNNELTGSIPEYLGTLTSLKVLDLQNNKFSGEIPVALLERKQASTLAFEFSGNPLCDTNSGVKCTPS